MSASQISPTLPRWRHRDWHAGASTQATFIDNVAELLDWLRIGGVSGDPTRAADLNRSGRWLARWLRAAGAAVRFIATPTAPVVTGLFRAREPDPQAPLGVLYGHYDVQPPGPGWLSDPFVPVVASGRIIARGASDDKGQLFAHLIALRDLHRHAALGGDVLVIAEGSEEIGSPGFDTALAKLPQRRAAAVIISDTQRAGTSVPSVTISQRGLLKLTVSIDVGGRPVHPGRYGGAVADPSLILARALTRLDAALRRAPAGHPHAPPRTVKWVSDSDLSRATGGRATAPSHNRVTRHQWLTTHTSLTISQLRAGSTSAAVPTQASAVLDIRLPPGVDPVIAESMVRRILARTTPPSTHLRIDVLGRARGTDHLPPRWLLQALDESCLAAFHRRPAYVRSGGSVPAVTALHTAFAVAPLLFGLGPPDDGAHGPNEYIDLRTWGRSITASTELWRRVTRHRPVSRA